MAAYAYIFHHSVPSLESPVRDKRSLVRLFSTASLVAMLLYLLVGGAVSLFFQTRTLSSSNLLWVGYRGAGPWLSPAVAFFVVVFPALDVASAFPLNAYTLGNNLQHSLFAPHSAALGGRQAQLRLCRGLAAALPLLGAYYDRDLGHVTDYTGLAAFVLAFVFPPLLAFRSEATLRDMGVGFRSAHSGFYSHGFFLLLLLLSGLGCLLYVAAQLPRITQAH